MKNSMRKKVYRIEPIYQRSKTRKDGTILHYLTTSNIKELLQRDFYFPNSIVPMSEDEAEKLYKECQ